jgi:RHS repeat-associated protein
MKCQPLTLAVTLAFLSFTARTAAQQANDGTRTGLPDTETPFQGVIDTISPLNGNLHLKIPLLSVPQRGGKNITWFYQYDIESWVVVDDQSVSPPQASVSIVGNPPDATEGWRLSNNLQWVLNSGDLMQSNNCTGPGGTPLSGYMDWSLTDPDGTRHPLFLISGLPAGCTSVTKSLTLDGSGILVDISQTPAQIVLKDGTQVSPTWKDTNGNTMSVGSDMLQRKTLVITDGPRVSYTSPLGATIFGPQYTTWDYTDTNGVSQSFRLDYQAVDVLTSFCSFALSSSCSEATSLFLVPKKLALPNNSGAYSFTWANNTAAELRQIDLPTGGHVSYTYDATGNSSGSLSPGGEHATYVRNSVATRTVSDGQNTGTWNYNTANGTITDPLGNKEVHTYLRGVNGCGFTGYFPNSYEKSIQLYDPAGTLVHTVQNDWVFDNYPGTEAVFDPCVPVNPRVIRKTTTLQNNLVSKSETDYETVSASFLNANTTYPTGWLNPTAIREYDYGASAAGPLLRTTNFTYLHSGSSTYQSRNIADRLLSKTVLDATGNQAAQTVYEYDVYNHPNQAMQSSGAVQHDSSFDTSFTYRGNLTAIQLWRNTDGVLLTTTNQYDDAGSLLSSIDPLTHKTSFDYTDSWANSACAPTGQGKAYLTKITNALNQVTTNSFNSCSGLTGSTKDPNLATTSFSYDLFGRRTQTNFADGGQTTNCFTDVGGSTCTATAPPFNIVTTTKIDSKPTTLTNVQVTDGLGRVKQRKVSVPTTTCASGYSYQDFLYDALGRPLTTSNPYCTTSDPTYGVATNSYDALGRVKQVTKQDGSISTADYSNFPTITVTDEAGQQQRSRTDVLGRLVEVDEPSSSGLASPWTTLYTYDGLGNLSCVEQHGDATSGTGCSASPSSDASSPWRVRRFTYDSLSRLLSSSNPEANTALTGTPPAPTRVNTTYTYDANGNLLQKTSPAPNQTGLATQTISYCYDALNRLTGKAYSAQTCTNGQLPGGTAAVSYSYDQTSFNGLTITNGIGRLTGMRDAAGALGYSYDPLGRTAAERRTINSVTKTMSYRYYLDGSINTLTYPSGSVITYTVDGAGRAGLVQDIAHSINYVTGTAGPSTFASYAPNGAITGFVSGNSSSFGGITNSFSYNTRLQPISMSASSPSQTVFSLGYDFHAGSGTAGSGSDSGNVYALTNSKDHTRDQTFTYDQLNRLTSAQNAGTDCNVILPDTNSKFWGNSYTYDAWGNLLAKNITKCGSETLSVVAQPNNQLVGFGYDAAGNMNSAPIPTGGQATSVFDAENRMTTANFGGAITNYTYDGNGNRVKKSNGTTGTLYWYMTPGVVAESDLKGNLQSEYIFFDGVRIARKDFPSNAVSYYFSDHLKTTNIVTDAQGNIKNESDYYPWGGELQFLAQDSNRYKFTGKERDNETQLDYFGARYYSNGLGRFITPDWSTTPIPVPYADLDDPQSLNQYSYVRNVPTVKVDPDGHDTNGLAHGVEDFDQRMEPVYEFVVRALNHPAVQAYLEVFGMKIGGAAEGGATEGAAAGAAKGLEEAAATGAAKGAEAGVTANAAKGAAFEKTVVDATKATDSKVAEQVTLKTESGVKTRMDVVSEKPSSGVRLQEAKSSATAPLTKGQKSAHPEIEKSGATVVGQGKPGYPGGTRIPPTKVEVVRPKPDRPK